MAENKQMNSRIQHKIDTAENWEKATGFTPLKGELIIYSDSNKIKIGDGETNVNDLEFASGFLTILEDAESGIIELDGLIPNLQVREATISFLSTNKIKSIGIKNGIYEDTSNEKLIDYFTVQEQEEEFRHEDGTIETKYSHSLYLDGDAEITGTLKAEKIEGYATTEYVDEKLDGLNFSEGSAVIGSGTASGENSTVIGTGTASGVGATVIGSGTAEGDGSVVFGNGTAFSDNSVAIGDSATAGCKGFYITGVEGKRILILSSKQGESAWGADEEELLSEWQPGDEISYKNDTRYVLKSVIESVDTATPSVTVKEDLPFDSLVVIGSPSYDEYSITNPRKPQAGIIKFAKGAFTAGINNSAAGTASIALGQGNLSAGEWSYTEGHSNTAIGTCSHAEGYNTIAGNGYAHTEGYGTIATGNRAHAEGWGSIASASAAHAEGRDTEANGWYAHAEGGASKANGLRSHAQGHATQANATDSHAEGDSTIASSTSQHVQGKFNIADVKRNENGDMLDSEGNVVTNYRDAAPADKYAHIVGNGTDNKNRSNAHTVDWDGNAWYAGKVASKGFLIATDDEKINFSVSSDGSATFNGDITLLGDLKAEDKTIYALEVVAEGLKSAKNNYSIAINDIPNKDELVGKKITNGGEVFNNYETSLAIGANSHVEGAGPTSQSIALTGEANATTYKVASDKMKNFAVNDWYKKDNGVIVYVLFVDTTNNTITVSETLSNTAITNKSFTRYRGGLAYGSYSHVEGRSNVASGNGSHAEGNNVIASGNYSHAEGDNRTTASGSASHAEGYGVVATEANQHAQGKYNYLDENGSAGNYAHIVGNGTSSSKNNRSNAHTLDWDGNAWFAGNVTVGEDKKELATKEYVDSKSGGSNGTITIPVPGTSTAALRMLVADSQGNMSWVEIQRAEDVSL